MPERNQKVFERVRQELAKNPTAGSRELYEMAQQVDKSIAQDSLQQFHARYVLPVKREQRAAEGGAATPRRTPKSRRKGRKAAAQAAEDEARPRRGRRSRAEVGSERGRVRGLLLQFAQELTDAESRSSLVQVLGRVDEYVSRIVPEGR